MEQPGEADNAGIETLSHCLRLYCCTKDHGHKQLEEEILIRVQH